jgi:hypothetical protein
VTGTGLVRRIGYGTLVDLHVELLKLTDVNETCGGRDCPVGTATNHWLKVWSSELDGGEVFHTLSDPP